MDVSESAIRSNRRRSRAHAALGASRPRARVPKAGPDAAAIGLPLGAVRFGQGRTSFLWSGTSLFTGRVCPGTCIDRAPDEGMVEQEIPPPPEG